MTDGAAAGRYLLEPIYTFALRRYLGRAIVPEGHTGIPNAPEIPIIRASGSLASGDQGCGNLNLVGVWLLQEPSLDDLV